MSDLTARLSPHLGAISSRAAALALLAALLWTVATFLILPAYTGYRTLGEDILDTRQQLGRVRTIMKGDRIGDNNLPADAFQGQSWSGKSEAIIAAKLQAFIQVRASAHRASVISISPLQGPAFEKFPTIGLRIECEGEIGAIRDLIADLENNTPFIFITGLDMRKQLIFGERQPGQRLPLSARLDVQVPLKIEEDG